MQLAQQKVPKVTYRVLLQIPTMPDHLKLHPNCTPQSHCTTPTPPQKNILKNHHTAKLKKEKLLKSNYLGWESGVLDGHCTSLFQKYLYTMEARNQQVTYLATHNVT